MQQNTYKKLATIREMLIEQLFELRGPGPPCSVCTPITGCFHDKTIMFKENTKYSTRLLFTTRILQEAMYFTSPYLGQITYKI